MTAHQLFESGKLAEAQLAAVEEVRKKPTDVGARAFLAELMCFNGELERADKQLDTLSTQVPDTAVNVAAFRQLIRGETARREFYTAGRVPEFLHDPSEAATKHLEASIHLREGDKAAAAALLAEAEELRPKCKGECDGEAFEDFRDLDDRLAPVFEVITSTGKYYWIPFEKVDLVEFHPPEVPRDLIWRRCHMIVQGGPDGEVFIPVTYVDTDNTGDEAIQLGRATDWRGEEGEPITGIGQRTFLVGEEDKPVMSIGTVSFAIEA